MLFETSDGFRVLCVARVFCRQQAGCTSSSLSADGMCRLCFVSPADGCCAVFCVMLYMSNDCNELDITIPSFSDGRHCVQPHRMSARPQKFEQKLQL